MITATAPPRPPGSPPGAYSQTPPSPSGPVGLAGSDDTSGTDVLSALAALIAIDMATLERDELTGVIATGARVRGWLDALDIGCARRARQLADDGTCESPESLFVRVGQRSNYEAAAIVGRAAALDEFAIVGGTSQGDASTGSGDAVTSGDTAAETTVGDPSGEPTSDGDASSNDSDSGGEPDSFERALNDGRISAGHVEAVKNAMRRLEGDGRVRFRDRFAQLLAAALTESVEGFTRRCQSVARQILAAQADSEADELERQRRNSSVKHWLDKITGMWHTKLELDPVRDAQVWAVINAHLASMRNAERNDRGDASTNGRGTGASPTWMELQVNAFVAAVTATRASASTVTAASGVTNNGGDVSDVQPAGQSPERAADIAYERRIPEITILIDYLTLTNGLQEQGICETEDGVPVPVSAVRRLCCDAEIIPVVLGTDGAALDAGRSSRTVTRPQRHALRAMYATCAHPDCTMPFSACRIHHVDWWWEHHGPTDLDNLIPLCERHHHLVHEGGWTLKMTPERITTWIRPDGTVFHHGPSTNRAATTAPSSDDSPGPSHR